jgi:hypothetical protein
MSTSADVAIPTRLKQMISTSKHMLTIFWSSLGFRVVRIPPKGVHFTTEYFRDDILEEIQRHRPTDIE